MTEPTTPPAAPAQEPTTPATPPWGADFDPEKAWSLVQNLRADKERLASRPALTAEQQQQLTEYQSLVQASKSEQQRQAEALQTAQQREAAAVADAIRYKAAATHGIPAEHFDLLGTGSEEQVTANAQKVAALLAAQVAEVTNTPPVTPTRLPVEQMRPGATPAGTETEDDVIYARLFGPPK